MKESAYNLLLSLILIFSILSCKNDTHQNYAKIVLKDDFGNTIELKKPPSRIISAAPSLTETIYYLHADSLLVGVSNYCNYPSEAEIKTKIGDLINPNIELINELKPDLILMSAEGNTKNTYYALKNMGFKIYVSNPGNIEGIIKMIEDVSVITGKKEDAFEKISYLKNYKLETDNIARPCLILISVSPFISINRNTFLFDVFYNAGYENIFKDEKALYPVISPENIISKKIENIFVISDTSESVKSEIKIHLEKSILNKDGLNNIKLIFLDQDVYSRPGPRILNAIETLRKY